MLSLSFSEYTGGSISPRRVQKSGTGRNSMRQSRFLEVSQPIITLAKKSYRHKCSIVHTCTFIPRRFPFIASTGLLSNMCWTSGVGERVVRNVLAKKTCPTLNVGNAGTIECHRRRTADGQTNLGTCCNHYFEGGNNDEHRQTGNVRKSIRGRRPESSVDPSIRSKYRKVETELCRTRVVDEQIRGLIFDPERYPILAAE